MAEELYTFKEICQMAGIPYSTGRYYRSKHGEFIAPVGTSISTVSTGRNKKYTKQAVEVLTFISNAYKTGASANEVQQRLSQHFPISVSNEEEVSQCSVTVQRNENEDVSNAIAPLALIANMAQEQKAIREALQKIAETLEKAKEQEQEIAKLRAEIEDLKKEKDPPWWKKLLF
ncbi:MAG: hypothetical protein H0Z19_11510 [Archaeoglobus sp.]|uniref:MerR family transcriptional regulator n=1 Tax=Archaeoglobus sp. TaxID=1872626 RepID=UPI001DEB49AB|nr:MerR family transcriptional regulator [Archaeoglobus sp.]MBO8181075.1 hypothetical protein [Archaeoglobus sp.]